MAVQFSEAVRNARLDAIETTISTTPKLRLWSGALPANCAAADAGTKLVEEDLPSDWMAAASGGGKAKSGTWSAAGLAAGDVAHFRVMDAAGTTCHMQGTVTATGGGGDMTMDNITVAVGQVVTFNTFTITDGNA